MVSAPDVASAESLIRSAAFEARGPAWIESVGNRAMLNEHSKAAAAGEFLSQRLSPRAEIGGVLGSGLALPEIVEHPTMIPYNEIPHWPVGNVEGHRGELIHGQIAGTPVTVLSGRAHLYEGFSAADVVFGVRVLDLLGIRSLILTNASGALDKAWTPGCLALICDHINLQGTSPLAGHAGENFGLRFVDMSEPYDSVCRNLARNAAASLGIDLLEGVYAAVLGPNFETPAEIKYLRAIGADMVGMSTVQETIAARQMGMKVLGISLITNWGSGLSSRPLSHEEVLAAGAAARPQMNGLLQEIVAQLESTP